MVWRTPTSGIAAPGGCSPAALRQRARRALANTAAPGGPSVAGLSRDRFRSGPYPGPESARLLVAAGGSRIVRPAAVFDHPSWIGPRRERDPGALSDSSASR